MCGDGKAVISPVYMWAKTDEGYVQTCAFGAVVPFNPQRAETSAGCEDLVASLQEVVQQYYAMIGDPDEAVRRSESIKAMVWAWLENRQSLLRAALVPGANIGRGTCKVLMASGDAGGPMSTAVDHYLFLPLRFPLPPPEPETKTEPDNNTSAAPLRRFEDVVKRNQKRYAAMKRHGQRVVQHLRRLRTGQDGDATGGAPMPLMQRVEYMEQEVVEGVHVVKLSSSMRAIVLNRLMTCDVQRCATYMEAFLRTFKFIDVSDDVKRQGGEAKTKKRNKKRGKKKKQSANGDQEGDSKGEKQTQTQTQMQKKNKNKSKSGAKKNPVHSKEKHEEKHEEQQQQQQEPRPQRPRRPRRPRRGQRSH